MAEVVAWIDEGGRALDAGAPPPPPAPFVGRKKELAALTSALLPDAAIAVVGPAGSGRSALARAAIAAWCREVGPGGLVLSWSPRRDGRIPQRTAHRWGRALGAPSPADSDWASVQLALADGMEAAAAAGPLLLYVEGLDAASMGSVSALLDLRPPGATLVVVTDDDEVVASLGLTRVEVGPLSLPDALALLRARAPFPIPQNTAVELVQGVGRRPLGVVLLATRISVAPAADLAASLERPEDLPFVEGTADTLGMPLVEAGLWLTLLASRSALCQAALRAATASGTSEVRASELAGPLIAQPHDVEAALDEAASVGLATALGAGSWDIAEVSWRALRALVASANEAEVLADAWARHLVSRIPALGADDPDARAALTGLLPDMLPVVERARSAGDAALVVELADALVLRGGLLPRLGMEQIAGQLVSEAAAAAAEAGDRRAPAFEAAATALAPAVAAAAEALDAARVAARELAQGAALEAEAAAAQAAVWVEGGASDAGHSRHPTVRELLSALASEGQRAAAAARTAAEASVALEAASTLRDIEGAATRAAAAREQAVDAAVSAEVLWTQLTEAVVAATSEREEIDRLLGAASEELHAARATLDEARAQVGQLRASLPDALKGPVADVWARVPKALTAAMATLRQADERAVGAAPRTLEEAGALHAELTALRERVLDGAAEAIAAATEAVDLGRSSEAFKEALQEADRHARQARDAGGRLERVRSKVRDLVGDHGGDAEAFELLRRVDALSEACVEPLRGAAKAVERVRKAHDADTRAQILREAEAAARIVGQHAVDGLGLLTEAEQLAKRLSAVTEALALERGRENAERRRSGLETRAEEAAGALARARDAAGDTKDKPVRLALEACARPEMGVKNTLEAARRALREALDAGEGLAATEGLGAANRLMDALEEEISDLETATGAVYEALRERLQRTLATLKGESDTVRASADAAREKAQAATAEVTEILDVLPSDPDALALRDRLEEGSARVDVLAAGAHGAMDGLPSQIDEASAHALLAKGKAAANDAHAAVRAITDLHVEAAALVSRAQAVVAGLRARAEALVPRVDDGAAVLAATADALRAASAERGADEPPVNATLASAREALDAAGAAHRALEEGLPALAATTWPTEAQVEALEALPKAFGAAIADVRALVARAADERRLQDEHRVQVTALVRRVADLRAEAIPLLEGALDAVRGAVEATEELAQEPEIAAPLAEAEAAVTAARASLRGLEAVTMPREGSADLASAEAGYAQAEAAFEELARAAEAAREASHVAGATAVNLEGIRAEQARLRRLAAVEAAAGVSQPAVAAAAAVRAEVQQALADAGAVPEIADDPSYEAALGWVEEALDGLDAAEARLAAEVHTVRHAEGADAAERSLADVEATAARMGELIGAARRGAADVVRAHEAWLEDRARRAEAAQAAEAVRAAANAAGDDAREVAAAAAADVAEPEALAADGAVRDALDALAAAGAAMDAAVALVGQRVDAVSRAAAAADAEAALEAATAAHVELADARAALDAAIAGLCAAREAWEAAMARMEACRAAASEAVAAAGASVEAVRARAQTDLERLAALGTRAEDPRAVSAVGALHTALGSAEETLAGVDAARASVEGARSVDVAEAALLGVGEAQAALASAMEAVEGARARVVAVREELEAEAAAVLAAREASAAALEAARDDATAARAQVAEAEAALAAWDGLAEDPRVVEAVRELQAVLTAVTASVAEVEGLHEAVCAVEEVAGAEEGLALVQGAREEAASVVGDVGRGLDALARARAAWEEARLRALGERVEAARAKLGESGSATVDGGVVAALARVRPVSFPAVETAESKFRAAVAAELRLDRVLTGLATWLASRSGLSLDCNADAAVGAMEGEAASLAATAIARAQAVVEAVGEALATWRADASARHAAAVAAREERLEALAALAAEAGGIRHRWLPVDVVAARDAAVRDAEVVRAGAIEVELPPGTEEAPADAAEVLAWMEAVDAADQARSAAVEAVATQVAALHEAVEAARVARLAEIGEVARALVSEGWAAAEAVRAGHKAATVESAGLREEAGVPAAVDALERRVEQVGEAARAVDAAAAAARASASPDEAWDAALSGARAAGHALAQRAAAVRDLATLRELVATITSARLAEAREEAAALAERARLAQARWTDTLVAARDGAATTRRAQAAEALAHLEAAVRPVFGRAADTERGTRRALATASLSQARKAVVDASRAVATLGEAVAAAEEVEVAFEEALAEAREADRRQAAEEAARSAEVAAAAFARAQEAAAAISEAVALWTYPPVLAKAADAHALVTRVDASRDDAASAAGAAVSAPTLERARELAAVARDAAAGAEELAVAVCAELDALPRLLEDALEGQRALFVEAAVAKVSEADEVMVEGMMMDGVAEDLVSKAPTPAVRAARFALSSAVSAADAMARTACEARRALDHARTVEDMIRWRDAVAEAAAGAPEARGSLDAAYAGLEAAFEEALAEAREADRRQAAEEAARSAEVAAAAVARAQEAAAAISEAVALWTYPPVLAKAADAHALVARVDASRDDAASAAGAAVSAPTPERARELAAVARDAAAGAEELAVAVCAELDALPRLLADALEGQRALFVEAAVAKLSEADEVMVEGMMMDGVAEDLVSKAPIPAVRAARFALSSAVSAADAMARTAREARRALDHARTVEDMIRWRDAVAQAVVGAPEARASLDAAYAALEAAVEAAVALLAERDEAVARLEAARDEVEVRADEAELLAEAASSQFDIELDPQVASDFRAAREQTAAAHRSLRALKPVLAALRAVDVREELTPAISRVEELLETGREAAEAAVGRLPALLDLQADLSRRARELLEARLAVGRASARTHQGLTRVGATIARARRAATAGSAAARSAWQEVADLREGLESARARLDALAVAVGGCEDPPEAAAMGAEAEGIADLAETGLLALREAAARAQRAELSEALVEASVRADARRDMVERALVVLDRIAPAQSIARAWAQAVEAWTAGFSPEEIGGAWGASAEALDAVHEAVARAGRRAERIVRAGESGVVEARVEAAEEAADALEAAITAAREAVDGLAVAVRGARDARARAREAALSRRQEAMEAATRLREGLGVTDARRQLPLFERGLRMARLKADPAQVAGWLLDVADLRVRVGDLVEASGHLEEALELARAHGARRREAAALEKLAGVRLAEGSPEDAAGLAEQALAIARHVGDEPMEDRLQAIRGEAHLARGETAAAAAAWEDALAHAERSGEERIAAVHRLALARLARRQGDGSRALVLAAAAADGFRRQGDRGAEALATALRAEILVAAGRAGEAVSVSAHAVDLARAVAERSVGALCEAVHAGALIASGHPVGALRRLAAVDARQDARVVAAIASRVALAEATVAVAPADADLDHAWASSKLLRMRFRKTDAPGVAPRAAVPGRAAAAARAWKEAAAAADTAELPELAGLWWLRVSQLGIARGRAADASAASAEALARLPSGHPLRARAEALLEA